MNLTFVWNLLPRGRLVHILIEAVVDGLLLHPTGALDITVDLEVTVVPRCSPRPDLGARSGRARRMRGYPCRCSWLSLLLQPLEVQGFAAVLAFAFASPLTRVAFGAAVPSLAAVPAISAARPHACSFSFCLPSVRSFAHEVHLVVLLAGGRVFILIGVAKVALALVVVVAVVAQRKDVPRMCLAQHPVLCYF